jgi:cyclase
MLKTRVIPTLLLKKGGLYKGIKFKNHQYIGDPINTVKIFNDKEVDELIILDISATNDRKTPDFDLLRDIASEAFMPLAYGGGISCLQDAKKLFSIGFEKIILNTYAVGNGALIREIADVYGSQSVVGSIDTKKSLFGGYFCYTNSGTKKTSVDPVCLAKEMESYGAGEIIINSIDKDGTMSGYDLRLINIVTAAVDIPVVALGGAGAVSDFDQAIKAGAGGVSAGSLFVFNGPHRAVLITYPTYNELERVLHA